MQIEKKAIFLTATLNDCSNQKKKKNPLKGPEERRRNLREHGQQALTTILRKSNICIKTAAIQGSFV